MLNAIKPLLFGLMLTVLTLWQLPAFADASYCLALRGNGESEPAHWGALANLVEKVGLPEAQVGGSSAAISLFLLDSVAGNPWVNEAKTPEEKKIRASFLLKSLHGMALYVAQTSKGKFTLDMLSAVESKASQLKNPLGVLKLLAEGANFTQWSSREEDIEKLVGILQDLGIASTPRYAFVVEELKSAMTGNLFGGFDLSAKGRFYAMDLYKALSTFGSFDAEGDSGLFLRDGILDFDRLGFQVGKIATFMAGGKNWDARTQKLFLEYSDLCEKLHPGKTWQEITKLEKNCQVKLNHTLNAFFDQKIDWNKSNVVLGKLGGHIPTFATTSVVTGETYNKARAAYENYHSELDREYTDDFKVTDTSEVRFGYWGKNESLALIEKNLKTPFSDKQGRKFDFSQDLKSRKFMALGEATWREVLRFSPAEPGLASLQRMKIKGEPVYSAGGWSDLHPVLVLKAAGCENVIYVTRRGGESLFGQGVAKRLLNLTRSWEVLRTSDPKILNRNHKLNDIGDAKDLVSSWGLLYNVANPQSSFMKSVATADAVLCTDWDRWDVKSQLAELVNESYKASYILNSSNQITKDLQANGAGILSNPPSGKSGLSNYSGCLFVK